ncbi:MAG: hypothetical protein HQM09_18135 [Candidatus Riflebacteria bacterium]|nr:hypothetical protein [Candidatus Riflebacteria bacterium]
MKRIFITGTILVGLLISAGSAQSFAATPANASTETSDAPLMSQGPIPPAAPSSPVAAPGQSAEAPLPGIIPPPPPPGFIMPPPGKPAISAPGSALVPPPSSVPTLAMPPEAPSAQAVQANPAVSSVPGTAHPGNPSGMPIMPSPPVLSGPTAASPAMPPQAVAPAAPIAPAFPPLPSPALASSPAPAPALSPAPLPSPMAPPMTPPMPASQVPTANNPSSGMMSPPPMYPPGATSLTPPPTAPGNMPAGLPSPTIPGISGAPGATPGMKERKKLDPHAAEIMRQIIRGLLVPRDLPQNPQDDAQLRKILDSGTQVCRLLGLAPFPLLPRFQMRVGEPVLRDRSYGAFEYRQFGAFQTRLNGWVKPVSGFVHFDMSFIGGGHRRVFVKGVLNTIGAVTATLDIEGYDAYGRRWQLRVQSSDMLIRDDGLPAGGKLLVSGTDPANRALQFEVMFPIEETVPIKPLPEPYEHRHHTHRSVHHP